jgi:predicted DNA binding protein
MRISRPRRSKPRGRSGSLSPATGSSAAARRARGRPGRSGAIVDIPQGYAVYRVVAPLSKDGWGYHFTRAHPSLRVEILNRVEISDDVLLSEVRMLGPGAFDWPAESRRFPSVTHVESHPEGPDSVVYRVTYRAPHIHAITRKHGVLKRYPIIVQNGVSQFETFAGPRQMQAYLRELTDRVGPSHVGSVQQGTVSTQSLGLTPGQVTIFQEAVKAGFFQVPRLVTLTGLAERLSRSKSTISTALVRIRKKLAESALQVDLSAFNSNV